MKNAGTELPKMWLAAEMMTRSRLNNLQKHNIMSTIDSEDSQNILGLIKKKFRDLDGCENDSEPKRAFYIDRKNSQGNSQDRKPRYEGGNRSFSRDGRNRSFNRDKDRRNSFSRGRNNERRSSFHRDGSTRPSFQKDGNRRPSFQKDGREASSTRVIDTNTTTPKRTYHVTLKMDNMKSIFENKVENKALVDSGCPELLLG